MTDALGQLAGWSDAWLKRYDEVWSEDAHWPPEIGQGGLKPAVLRVRARVGEVRASLERLRKASKVLEGRMETIEKRLQEEG